MGRNGYNDSLLDTMPGVCYVCKSYCETARHEVFQGNGTRALSKRYGLWVNICPSCHDYIHNNPLSEDATDLKRDAEEEFLKAGHTPEQFRKIFITGNVKWWEIE